MKRILSRVTVLITLLMVLTQINIYAQSTITEIIKQNKPPKLVVLIVVDQGRADYITRYREWFKKTSTDEPGGFRYFIDNGALFLNAHWEHIPTGTGPGHGAITTGSIPALTGIVANNWYNRQTKQPIYCAEDARYKSVGIDAKLRGSAPTLLQVTTVGDELRLATAGKSKVISIAMKDRAAILMGGHNPNAVVWYDDKTGNWITSSYYAKDEKLYTWAEEINKSKIIDTYFGKEWDADPMLKAKAVSFTKTNPNWILPEYGLSSTFPHKISGKGEIGPEFYKAFTLTPWANQYTLDLAKKAIKSENLGVDEIPDLLCINLSTDDYLGHVYGPYSPEVMDLTVQLDKQLSDFFKYINTIVPGGLNETLITVTADHGVATIPAQAVEEKQNVQVVDEDQFIAYLNDGISKIYGKGDWVAYIDDVSVYLNKDIADNLKVNWSDVLKTAAELCVKHPSMLEAYHLEQIATGSIPNNHTAKYIYSNFNNERSGDIIIIMKPGWMFGSEYAGTGHGSPYRYDTHVMLMMRGAGIKQGVYTQKVATYDIAPTFSTILGISFPSGCVGEPISEAIAK